MIFNNKSIPNACQTVKIGAELQNKGANQFHNNETIHPDNAQHANRKAKNWQSYIYMSTKR